MLMGCRSPKQCHERYYQNLKPYLNHNPISPQGFRFEQLVAEIGKRWAKIAWRLQDRNDNAVKIWWDSNINCRRPLAFRQRTSPSHPKEFDERAQSLNQAGPAAPQQFFNKHRLHKEFGIDCRLTHQEKHSSQHGGSASCLLGTQNQSMDETFHHEWRAHKFESLNLDWQQPETVRSP